MRIFLLGLFAVCSAGGLALPALAQDKSFFDQGQIVLSLDPLKLVQDEILLMGGEYYITNEFSAGASVFTDLKIDASGMALFGRFHFMPAGEVFKDDTVFRNGNFYAFGGYGSTSVSVAGVSARASSFFGGAGYLFVISKSWVVDLAVSFVLDDGGWADGLFTGIGWAL